MSHSRERTIAYVGLVFGALFWAGNAVLARAIANEIRPVSISFWRWAGALVVILPFGLPHVRRAERVIRANVGHLFWLGLLSVATNNTLLYLAAHSTPALNIALVNSTNPIVIAIFARFILDQRTTRAQVAGFVAAGVGMLTIVARGDWRVLAGFDWNAGDLVMIVAVIVWGLYSVLLRVWRIEIHPVGLLTVTIAVGVVLLLPAYVWEVATFGHFAWRPMHLPLFAYLAIFPSVLAFLYWNRGVTVLGPAVAGMFIYLVPVFTVILARVILGEQLHGYHAIGGSAILLGLYLANRPSGELPTESSGEPAAVIS